MDIESIARKGKVSLLTLPRTDLSAAASAKPISTTRSNVPDAADCGNNDDDENDSNAPLMLLKLPSEWSVDDLRGSHFVASETKQASLVVEPKRKSFAVHKAETSNVLVMVPPSDIEGYVHEKKSKVTEDGKFLVSTPCRLLSKGGSGASYFELREKILSTQELVEVMKCHTFDPYKGSSASNTVKGAEITGRTAESLSQELQISIYEVERGLERIQAFPLPRRGTATDAPSYALLAEEAKLECYNAILAALAEVDEYQDYAGYSGGGGVNVEGIVTAALQRMSDEERFDDADAVLRYCLITLAISCSYGSGDTSKTESTVRLDLRKVRTSINLEFSFPAQGIN